MTKEDRDRSQARADKVARAAQDARSGKAERDASSKAVLDNMAKLKALRLAREAAEPQRAPAAKAAKKACCRHQAVEREAGGLVRLAGEPAERRTANLRPDSS